MAEKEVVPLTAIPERVIDIVVEQLGLERDKVHLDSKIVEDLGADSLDSVELIMAFEDEFGNEIPDEDAEKLTTLRDVIAYIEAHPVEKS